MLIVKCVVSIVQLYHVLPRLSMFRVTVSPVHCQDIVLNVHKIAQL